MTYSVKTFSLKSGAAPSAPKARSIKDLGLQFVQEGLGFVRHQSLAWMIFRAASAVMANGAQESSDTL